MGPVRCRVKGRTTCLIHGGLRWPSASLAAVSNASVCSRRHQQQFEPYNWTELRIMDQILCFMRRNKWRVWVRDYSSELRVICVCIWHEQHGALLPKHVDAFSSGSVEIWSLYYQLAFMYGADWSSGTNLDLYSGGSQLESRPDTSSHNRAVRDFPQSLASKWLAVTSIVPCQLPTMYSLLNSSSVI